ncbi:Vacuolar membrane protein [Psilocybe cubensis]|uniref:Vacuolar membrane protein n=2 Tax=Psilocybe cubensis TaxID=181762 RepID=A0ACB8H506_PSICU|nr:Vacuolar membrane protein [Psilocybe cubensis]KAH9482941.1 Vacuolar membrane protein [Psilocybe cubensis]
MSVLNDDSLPSTLPDVDQPSCQLLGPTALIVQALMGLLVILSLVYKRHRETPKRPWRIWRQILGQAFVHGANLLVSDLVSSHTSSNACVSYFLNILIDTTFGVALIYVTLHALTNLFTEKLHMKGFESGVYGTPPSFEYWARQAAIYVLALTTMKVVVITILIFFPGIYVAGEWLLSWTWSDDGDSLQVVFVMGIFPILMNVLQFWLIDSIVKASAAGSVALDVEQGNYQDREPLFNAADDDDEHSERFNADATRTSRHSLSSLESGGSRENVSFGTETTTTTLPDERKSAGSSSRHTVDVHEYPPSLSSSFSSNASAPTSSKVPREAKNLQKKSKRRQPLSPLPLHSTKNVLHSSSHTKSTIPATPSPPVEPSVNIQDRGEWPDVWDESNEWDQPNDHKQISLTHEWSNSQAKRTNP